MVLTEEGKRFYQLSLQYQDIVRSMLAIGNPEKQSAAVRSQQRVHVSAAAGV